LKGKTIQEGDVYAAVCGAKEPRGRVRVLGLGPTPQEIGIPGLKGLMSQGCKWKFGIDTKLKV